MVCSSMQHLKFSLHVTYIIFAELVLSSTLLEDEPVHLIILFALFIVFFHITL